VAIKHSLIPDHSIVDTPQGNVKVHGLLVSFVTFLAYFPSFQGKKICLKWLLYPENILTMSDFNEISYYLSDAHPYINSYIG